MSQTNWDITMTEAERVSRLVELIVELDAIDHEAACKAMQHELRGEWWRAWNAGHTRALEDIKACTK